MKKIRQIFSIISCLLLIFILGCQTDKVTSINIGSDVTLEEGEIIILKTELDVKTSDVINWDSSNKTVATVSDGTVRALKEGTTIISASIDDVSANITVTVTSKQTIELNFDGLLIVGDTRYVEAVINKGLDSQIVWESGNKQIATIQNGAITALKEGTVNIKATINGVSDNIDITVLPEQTIEISLDDEILDGETKKINVSLNYGNLDDVKWTSSDETIATIANGSITALKEGKVKITASINGTSAEIMVTIASSLFIISPKEEISVGEEITLSISKENSEVTWSSSNNNVATISSTGIVKGLTNGNVTIYATVNGKVLKYDLFVKEALKITISGNFELIVNTSSTFTATTNIPTTEEFVWTTSDPAILEVVDGFVIAMSVGTAVVTVNCGEATESVTVVVKKKGGSDIIYGDIDTRYTDQLKLDGSSTGKEFISDGIGEVTINTYVDGDTFTVRSKNRSITIRFLGVDTPESTGTVEPWGKAASYFVKTTIKAAYKVVLEAEGDRTDSNGRYLAWIWYQPTENADFRLLNLELVENAYSKFTFGQSKYHQTFLDAHEKTRATNRGVYGEKDPDYNYDNTITESTIAYLKANVTEIQTGTQFRLTAMVARTVGNSFYLQDVITTDVDGEIKIGYSYCYTGYGNSYYHTTEVGDVINFVCKIEKSDNYGIQLTDVKNLEYVMVHDYPKLEIFELEGSQLTKSSDLANYDGQVIRFNNLIFVSKSQSASDKEDTSKWVGTLHFKTENGIMLDVRVGSYIVSKYDINTIFSDSVINQKFDIIGGISSYQYAEGGYQIVLGDRIKANDIIQK